MIETTLSIDEGRQGKVLVSWNGLLCLRGARQAVRWSIQSLHLFVVPLLIIIFRPHIMGEEIMICDAFCFTNFAKFPSPPSLLDYFLTKLVK